MLVRALRRTMPSKNTAGHGAGTASMAFGVWTCRHATLRHTESIGEVIDASCPQTDCFTPIIRHCWFVLVLRVCAISRHRSLQTRWRASRRAISPPLASRYRRRGTLPAQIPIAELAARPTEAYFPRFRALALFGRRPPERLVRSWLPASENLHMSRHMQCSN